MKIKNQLKETFKKKQRFPIKLEIYISCEVHDCVVNQVHIIKPHCSTIAISL
jgi:hypothetical protein